MYRHDLGPQVLLEGQGEFMWWMKELEKLQD